MSEIQVPPPRSRQRTPAPTDKPRRSAKTTGGTSRARVMSAVLRALRTEVMPKLASRRRRDSGLAGRVAGRPGNNQRACETKPWPTPGVVR